MSLIKWDDSFSVNIKTIDEQHKMLVGMFNEIHNNMMHGKGEDIVDKILDDMVAYTKDHFATEERYFRQYKYPDSIQHIREHDDFIRRIFEFKKDTENNKHGLSNEVMFFLEDWLINHIKGSDKQYSSFFNERGLK